MVSGTQIAVPIWVRSCTQLLPGAIAGGGGFDIAEHVQDQLEERRVVVLQFVAVLTQM